MKRIWSILTVLMVALPLYAQRFVDVTAQTGIDTSFFIHGIWDVFDRGYEDFIAISGQSLFGGARNRFYYNNCDGTFDNITATSGLDFSDSLVRVEENRILFYDLDKDGFKDVIMGARRDNGAYIVVWGSVNGFNMMDTTAIDTALNDIVQQSHMVKVLDIDRDGRHDLEFTQVANEPPRPNRICYFRNNGDRTFTEIFNPVFPPPPPSCNINTPFGFGLHEESDYNSDGIRDFAGYWDGVGWGRRIYRFGRGTGIPPPPFPNRPCWNPDTLDFDASVDSIRAVLLMEHDFNNDGYIDFAFCNSGFFQSPLDQRLFISQPQTNRKVRYKNILPDSFLTFNQTPFNFLRASDFNGDGSLDIVGLWIGNFTGRTTIWQNLLPSGDGNHNFLKIKLEGVQSNREGIGASVIIVNSDTTGGKWWRQIRVVNPVGQILHFGLASTTVVDSIYVNWPSGHRDLLRHVAANQTLTIREGNSPLSVGTSRSASVGFFYLAQNYPNPFNPTTRIAYQIPKTSEVKLKVYDVLGREVETLVSGVQQAGRYEVMFNASRLASGVYFYRWNAGRFTETKKMLLVK